MQPDMFLFLVLMTSLCLFIQHSPGLLMPALCCLLQPLLNVSPCHEVEPQHSLLSTLLTPQLACSHLSECGFTPLPDMKWSQLRNLLIWTKGTWQGPAPKQVLTAYCSLSKVGCSAAAL